VIGRTRLAVAAGLTVLLLVGGVTAWASAGRPAAGWAIPAAGAGPGEVELSAGAAAHPRSKAVRVQLQRHFDAINVKDYELWQETVVPARSAALPEPAWQQAYRSTRDGAIRVGRIVTAPDGVLLVRVRFVSTQAVEDAPPDLAAPRICWRSTLPMVGTPPRIGLTGGGSSAAEAC
jgi:hypothetical protein